MCTATKGLATALLMLFAGLSAFSLTPAQTVNLPADPRAYSLDDDGEDEPEVTARVGRVSFLTGEARIKRVGSDDWEKVTLNLPIIEGDEIATDRGARLEIQFDKYQHVRLSENGYLKIVTLKDNAVAVSLSLGTMTIRIRAFDKDRSFEIDAPRTTVAIQKSGAYRIDAGREGDTEIRVAAREDGEARVYSENAGFLLKNGRSTRIFIEGPRVGEWETGDASNFNDEFDDWSAARDAQIAKRLDSSYYGKYYDDDIYGADDLADEGEWIDIPGYGNVWRPYATTISSYADWSPYRYGTWRWMSPYGWIWVNDEPWGWATYHHGRWFYYNGRWHWSPYGYYRSARSWWYPALVSINFVFNNTCWYPLPYHHRYHRFNNHGGGNGGNGHGGPPPRSGKGGNVQPVRPPVNVVAVDRNKPAPVDRVPPGGIVMLDNLQFGTGAKPTRKAPAEVVQQVLSGKLDQLTGRGLPAYKDVSTRIGRDIVAAKPRVLDQVVNMRTGAAIRKADVPLDTELRTKTVFGGRNPRPEVINGAPAPVEGRKQGAFERQVPPRSDEPRPAVERIERPKPEVTRDPQPRTERPRDPAPMQREKPAPAERPQYVPPMEREKPRPEPPQQRSEPKPSPAPLQRSEPKPSPPAAKDDGGKGKPDKPDKPR